MEGWGMPERLDFIDRRTLHFGAGDGRWLDIKRFALPAGLGDREVVALLLQHERYRDDYASEPEQWTPKVNVHGPYWLSAIEAAYFDPVRADETVELFADWAAEWEGSEEPGYPEIVAAVSELFGPHVSVYRLRDLRETAEHAYGHVLGDFHEYVVLDRAAQTLSLAVASDD